MKDFVGEIQHLESYQNINCKPVHGLQEIKAGKYLELDLQS